MMAVLSIRSLKSSINEKVIGTNSAYDLRLILLSANNRRRKIVWIREFWEHGISLNG